MVISISLLFKHYTDFSVSVLNLFHYSLQIQAEMESLAITEIKKGWDKEERWEAVLKKLSQNGFDG